MRPPHFILLLATLALMAGLAGCRDNAIQAYRVPREKSPEPPAGSAAAAVTPAPASAGASTPDMASTPVPTATGNELVWTAPDGWTPRTASAMRKATYVISGPDGASAELAITAFPGNVGGDLANINRWRGELDLPPIAASELSSALVRFEANGLSIGVAEMVGTTGNPPARMLGGIVPFAGSTWFFKLTGPDPLVASTRQAFIDFLRTVRAP